MTKAQFLAAVRARLAGLSQSDIDRSLDFYAEMIDDRIDEGLSEEEAVAAMGSPEYVASQILMDTPLPKLVKAKAKPSEGWKGWQILLLILGAPIWLPLLLSASIVLFAAFVSVWAVVFSLFATVFALGIAGIACIVGGIVGLFTVGFPGITLAVVATGMFLLGISILLFLAIYAVCRGIIGLFQWLTKKIKSLFIKKEEAA